MATVSTMSCSMKSTLFQSSVSLLTGDQQQDWQSSRTYSRHLLPSSAPIGNTPGQHAFWKGWPADSVGSRAKLRCGLWACDIRRLNGRAHAGPNLAHKPANGDGGGVVFSLLRNASSLLPQAVVLSTLLAIVFPPSFSWFTTKYYAPALGFLMFAVGINLSLQDFQRAFASPAPIAAGFFCQFGVKPLLGTLVAATIVPLLGLPEAIGSGLMLTACVSGAQLSNYATFLVDPPMAPLSIVMTALSTATAALVTPLLTLLLLGKKLPVDFFGMMRNITQIVLVPIGAGLLLNRCAAPVSAALRPFLPALSVLVTSLCVGSPLAVNIRAVRSPQGAAIVLPVFLLHASAFVAGFHLSKTLFPGNQALARTISFETGMQSSLLALALANQFFPDPLVGLPCAVSTVLMSIMGFALVLHWNKAKEGMGAKV